MAAFNEVASGGMNFGGNMLKGALGAALLAAGAKNGIIRLHKGEVAIKENRRGLPVTEILIDRYGKEHEMQKTLLPGVHFMVPGLQKIKKISVQDRTDSLDEFPVDRSSAQWNVNASIVWGVSPLGDNPLRALYTPDTIPTLREGVIDVCQDGLVSTLMDCDEELFSKSHLSRNVFESFNDNVKDELGEWGVELRKLRIKGYAKSIGQMMVTAAERGNQVSYNGTPAQIATILGQNGHEELAEFATEAGLHVVD